MPIFRIIKNLPLLTGDQAVCSTEMVTQKEGVYRSKIFDADRLKYSKSCFARGVEDKRRQMIGYGIDMLGFVR